jgi:shikimate dehydrogenase
MERTLAAAGLDWRFLTLDIAPEDLAAAIDGAAAMGFIGGIVRPPHESSLAERLSGPPSTPVQLSATVQPSETASESEPLAASSETAGGPRPTFAVASTRLPRIDFLVREAGRWTGRYLLGETVVEAAASGGSPEQDVKRTAILWGKGELAEGLREMLLRAGFVVHREDETWAIGKCHAVIDARDLAESPPLAQLQHLPDSAIIIDASTPASFSPLTQAAAGRRVVSGLDLAVSHAQTAFRHWTGGRADPQVLREAFEEFWEI